MVKTRKRVVTSNRSQRSTKALPYVSRKTLLTPGERRFFLEGLLPAVGERYLISFKVRLADVITTKEWTSKHGRKISQKHLGFVLVTPKAMRFVAAIELNDATHEADDRMQRDQFVAKALAAAGIPLVSFPIFRSYDPEKIRNHISRAVRPSVRKA